MFVLEKCLSADAEVRKPFKSRSAKTEAEFSTAQCKENFSWGKKKEKKDRKDLIKSEGLAVNK